MTYISESGADAAKKLNLSSSMISSVKSGRRKMRDNSYFKYYKDFNKEEQERDKIKNQYALDNNIDLIRIPYWERDDDWDTNGWEQDTWYYFSKKGSKKLSMYYCGYTGEISLGICEEGR